jgi:hypothetical protein
MATKNTARAEQAETKSYTVLSKLEHDGKLYQPDSDDDTVELTVDQAKPLLDLKVVTPKPAAT